MRFDGLTGAALKLPHTCPSFHPAALLSQISCRLPTPSFSRANTISRRRPRHPRPRPLFHAGRARRIRLQSPQQQLSSRRVSLSLRVIIRQVGCLFRFSAPVTQRTPFLTDPPPPHRSSPSRGCLSQLWDACMTLTYECASAQENAADMAGTACRRMLPHMLSCILGWRFAEGDNGWSPRHACLRATHAISLLIFIRYTFSDSKAACIYPGSNWAQRLAAVDVLGPVLALACGCR
jgi:hypothetical protein